MRYHLRHLSTHVINLILLYFSLNKNVVSHCLSSTDFRKASTDFHDIFSLLGRYENRLLNIFCTVRKLFTVSHSRFYFGLIFKYIFFDLASKNTCKSKLHFLIAYLIFTAKCYLYGRTFNGSVSRYFNKYKVAFTF